jgi:riboflavin kinase/FMN adenylyltransferase
MTPQMKIIEGYRDVPPEFQGAAIAIGNFDGVHRGHQKLISRVGDISRSDRIPGEVMLFEPHPREFFRPAEPHFRLTSLPEKLRLFERLGLDAAVVLPFNAELASLPAERFIGQILVEALRVKHVVIGYDFFFGRGRSGDPETMRAAGRTFGFEVSVIAPVAEAGEPFSSSAIRAQLSAGDVRGAALSLGHWWRVSGVVTGGAKRGTELGFPTANITLPKGTALGHGIYAARVFVVPDRYVAAAYLGTRPTFDDGAPVLEVFLIDFDGDLYGRKIEVEFLDFVRVDKRFNDIEALKAQMTEDCSRARVLVREIEADNPLADFPLGAV